MGTAWSKLPARPDVESVTMGAGGEEPFEKPLEMRIAFVQNETEKQRKVAWRVLYEVDISDWQQQHVLLEVEASPLRSTEPHVIRVPSSCFKKLRSDCSPDRLCNVSVLAFVMLDESLEGAEVMRVAAVVEVYQMDSRAKLQVGSLRRRVYCPEPPF